MSDEAPQKESLNQFSHSVRASQSILQYGVGNIVDFPDQTLMTAAPKFWKDQVIKKHDGRLEKLLHVTHFGMPGNGEQGCKNGISYVRFPEWYFCPKCRRFMPLTKWLQEYRSKAPQKVKNNDPFMVKNLKCYNCRQSLVITRIITVCPNGHIDDFPWIEWTHCKNQTGPMSICPNPQLTFTTSLSGSEGLEGLTLTCTCGARATLKDAFNKGIFKSLYKKHNGTYDFRCKGRHPWKNIKELCEFNNERCFPEVRQRGASSIYFPILASSLVIPPYSSILQKKIENSKAFESLSNQVSGIRNIESLPVEMKEKTIKELITKGAEAIQIEIAMGVPVKQITDILEQRWVGENEPKYTTDSYEYRAEEYSALSGQVTIKEKNDTDFSRESTNIRDYNLPYITNISLIHKVREVQALLGYSRLYPVESMNSKSDKAKAVSIRDKDMDWYPAYEVRGEGIFIEFDNDYLEKWISKSLFTQKRINQLTSNYQNSYFGKEKSKVYTAKFLILHTLSHLLIKQLSFECGYGIASLKERIYCSKTLDPKKMAGILIYTASGDSEGTLGGLVRQGRADIFPSLFKKALQTALTCSNDPVCSCSNGQGRDSLNLAACYSCALIPETSCEEFNAFLDRGVIVGTMEHPDEGIYSPQLTNQQDWECTVDENYKQEHIEISNPQLTVSKDSGINLADDSYSDIWKYIDNYSDNATEKKIIAKLLENIEAFENKEKPYRDCSGQTSLTDSSLQCDLVWFESKVIYFSAAYADDYDIADTCEKEWQIFCGADEAFNVEDFIKAIGEK